MITLFKVIMHCTINPEHEGESFFIRAIDFNQASNLAISFLISGESDYIIGAVPERCGGCSVSILKKPFRVK